MKHRPGATTAWFPQAAIGVAVLIVGVTLVLPQHRSEPGTLALHVLLVLCYAVAAGTCRRAPGPALAVTVTIGLVQAVSGGGVLVAQLAVLVVVYTGARWGRTPVPLLSVLAVPLGAAVGWWQLGSLHIGDGAPAAGDVLTELLLSRAIYWHTATLILLGAVLVGCAWVSGFALRMRDRAVSSESESVAALLAAEVADRTAGVRAAQAELARDVHDVVGHSLAVVLAQAEAARVLDDPARVREMLGHIVDTTRSSLRDVRAVLSDTAAASPGSLDDLIGGVAASREVVANTTGDPRPLPPDLQAVVYRVFQEMLTNALRHGVADRPIRVLSSWDRNTVTLTVVNDTHTDWSAQGQGIPGMVRRLAAIGGTIDLTRAEATVTARAVIPVRSVAQKVTV